MTQEHTQKSTEKSETPPTDGDAKGLSPESQAKVDKATEDFDGILDEIDEMLGTEAEAESLVSNYVQRGGE